MNKRPELYRRRTFSAGVVLLLFWIFFVAGSTSTAAARSPAQNQLCSQNSAIPQSECETLVSLYQQTNGPSWADTTNWLSLTGDVSPCDWFGITCSGDSPQHVTAVVLPGNGLEGSLPREIADFEQLTRLDVANNALESTIRRDFCRLTDTLTDVNLDYNKLRAAGNQARHCLDAVAPGWSTTQTVPPENFAPAEIGTDFVELTWTPISYQSDAGRYEVAVSEKFSGAYTRAAQTADKTEGGVRVEGLAPGRTYYIRLHTVTEPHDGQVSTLTSDTTFAAISTDSSATILLIVYFAADNNLTVYVDPLLKRMADGTLLNSNLTVLALVDRLGEDNSEVWQIEGGEAILDSGFRNQLGTAEFDTADPALLAAYLSYARSRIPADRVLVSLLGHGVGLAPELAWLPPAEPDDPTPKLRRGIPPLPRGKNATPTDVTSGSFMSTPALGQALAQATDSGANPVDLLFFDQCFAGNLDILYEVRTAAKVFVASPNYAWLTAPYARYMPELSPNRTPEEMANAVINVYQQSLNDAHPNAIFWLRSDDIVAVADAVDDLAAALVDAVDDGAAHKILTAAQSSKYVDTTQCGLQNLKLGPPDELLGAGSFAEQLKQQFGSGDPQGVSTSADRLLAALANVTGNARTGNPYIDPDELWDYDDTLTILAPLRPDAPANVAWRASLYREDIAGSEAVWSPDPGQTVLISTTFSYVEDRDWDDFIARWYDGELEPTVGEWCSYTPPSLVVAEDVEKLTLDVALGNTLRLVWSPPLDDTPAMYAIFARRPGDVGWNLIELLDGMETQRILTNLDGGGHRFMVAAINDDGEYFAKSDYVQVSVNDPDTRLFLPMVLKQ